MSFKKRTPSRKSSQSSEFRRGQTLNIYRPEEPSSEESARAKSHARTRRYRRIIFPLAAILALVVLVIVALSQFVSSVNVDLDLEASGQGSREAYISNINDYYKNSPLERFYFMLNRTNLLNHIQSEFPEVQDISNVEKTGILTSQLTFTLSLRQPIASWTISDTTYFVDSAGKAFTKNYFTPPTLSIVDENNLTITPGETTIASARLLEFVGKTASALESESLSVEKIVVPLGMSREVDFYFKDKSTYFKLSTDRSPKDSVADVATTLSYLSANSLSPSYVDLRLSGKAFYK